MADNVAITAGTGTTIAADEVTDGALGSVKVQFVKVMDGTLDSSNKLVVDSHGSQQATLKDASGVAVDLSTGTAGSPAGGVSSVQGAGATGTPINVINLPRATANGSTSSRVNSGASTNATSLKASAGNVVNIDVFNVAAYSVFLKLYNKASAPTVGSDTPVWTIPIAAGTGYSKEFVQGKSFATGIAYAITKLQADSDTTVVAAGDLTGSVDWI